MATLTAAANQGLPANAVAASAEDSGQEQHPERQFEPGELGPFWASPYPNAQLSKKARLALEELCHLVGNKDVAARRWEVEQSWEMRLFWRGYQYLLPRKGGGWILPPFATNYNSPGGKRSDMKWYGYETNMLTTYGEVILAALTRDIPRVRFEPSNPESDSDITAASSATSYARNFGRDNDLMDIQQQLAYYLCTDGRVIAVVDHLLDAGRFGRREVDAPEPVVPEDMSSQAPVALYLVRHGETELNRDGKARGRADALLDDTGERQIERTAKWLQDKGIRAVVCSPVPRALESGQFIAQTLGVPFEADDRLASLDVGQMTGEDSGDASEQIEQYEENPDQPMPGGESFNQFHQRVQQAIFGLVQSAQQPIAVVTHDSVISEIFKLFHGDELPPGTQTQPGGVAAVHPNADGTYNCQTVYPFTIPESSVGQHRGAPRGREVVEVFGKLEGKVPINAQTSADCPFIQVSKEYDLAYVKGMFPEYADKIKPGAARAGENELDRIARINACLALEASYVTGDSMVRDCTVQRTWFRPAFFMEVKDPEVREELFQNFPDGALVIFAGETMVLARNENMDDHVTLIQAYPGSGMNRLALCSKLLSLQKRLNNWVDLINDYFIRTVPMKHLAAEVYDIQALRQQTNTPGDVIPFSGSKAMELTQAGVNPVFIEGTPQPQPAMPQFIQLFINEFPQLLSGALPSLFGSPSNTDTVGGIAIQRDQALGRLGTPWHSIKKGWCSIYKQAVQLAARCRTEDIRGFIDGQSLRVELADLKGNVLAFPEENATFPESWVQKQQRYQEILMDAQNPLVQAILAEPRNLRIARDAIGIQGFEIPQADSYEKQMGEFELLLKTGPLPNPAKMELQQQMEALTAQHQQQAASGFANPQVEQMLQQASQQLQSMPDMISSVQIDVDTDDHAAEEKACLDWINRPEGRRMRDGTPQEREAFQNVRLHMLEHREAKEAKQAKSSQMQKPPSFSANYKDMPPDAQAALLQSQGLPASPDSTLENREANAAIKKSSKVGGPTL